MTRVPTRLGIVALVLLLTFLIASGCFAQSVGSVNLVDGALEIESPANTFALLVHPLELDDEPGELTAEIKIRRVDGAMGASWGPGVYLYWDSNAWIGLRLSNGVFRLEGQIGGSQTRRQDFPLTPEMDDWNGLRLVWRRGVVDVFASNDLSAWHLLTTVNRPGSGLPWLMVGKGYAASSLPEPFLANVYTDLGEWGTVQVRDLRVTVDGAVMFADDFDGDVLDDAAWTVLIDGDPDFLAGVERLNQAWSQVVDRRVEEAAAHYVSRKTRTNLLTSEEIEEARRTRKWPETGTDVGSIIANAERWMKYTPAELRDMVPPPEVPRAFDVHFKQSPTHPEEIKAYGSYPWIIDIDRPYKLISPVDGSVFPTNDFDPKNPGGPEDVTTEPYVDTGWGWKDPNDPQKYWFVAYWAHWFWHGHLVPGVESLAQAYIVTGDQRYARQAAAVLDQIAEYYPRMDHVNQSRYGTEIQPGNYHGRIVNSIWETGLVRTLARAYDFAFEGMEGDTELEAVTGKSIAEIRANIEQNLLEDAARSIYTMDGRIRGNFGMHHSALATIAIVLDNENTEKYLDWVLNATGLGPWPYEGIIPGLTNFIYRDGAPNESSPGYNSLWIGHFQIVSEILLRRGIDLYAEQPRLKRLFDYPLRLAMPGNFSPNIGDTGSVRSAGIEGWNSQRYATAYQRYRDASYITGRSPYTAASDNMSGYGLAMLRRGSGANGMGLSMYYGPSGGHGHWDRLNIELFALGQRIMPDLGYPEYMSGFHKKLAGWTGHTISHNTVLVNEERQHTKDGGRLQAFAGSPTVQYVDARAEEAYPGVVDRYQRAVTMVDVSSRDAYVVDIFRVSGGTHHDYSFHGPDGDVQVSNVMLSAVQERGTLAGEDVPFGYLYDAPQYEAPGFTGSYGGYRGSGFSYLRNVQRGTSSDVWQADWTLRDDRRLHLRATFVPDRTMNVVLADGEPPLNKAGNPKNLKYVLLRNQADENTPLESTFVTVVEPYRGEPFIADVRRLDTGTIGSEGLVALEIERTDGTDYLFQSPNTTTTHEVGETRFDGRLGVVSRDQVGTLRFAYLLDGRTLEQGDLSIQAAESYEGEIIGVDFGARQVTVAFDRGSTDGLSEALVGQRMVIYNDLHATEYIVETVESGEDGRYVLTLGDTDFLTGMGQLNSVVVQQSRGQTHMGSRTPLVLGTYHRGQWMVNPVTGAGGRIIEMDSVGNRIVVDSVQTGLTPGDRFEIYDFGIGDRFRISNSVHVEHRGRGEYRVQSNVPVRLQLSDRREHRLDPGQHTVQVEVPTLTWTGALADVSGDVAGALPLSFTLDTSEGFDVTEVEVFLGDERLYSGVEPPRPGELVLDTFKYPDGEHTLSVILVDSLNRRFTESVRIRLANRWEEIDDLRPPVTTGWFLADFTKTSARSEGWEYRTDRRDDYYGDNDRLAKVTREESYLVWDAPRLQEFVVTMYAETAETGVKVEVSTDGVTWHALEVQPDVEGPNDAGVYAIRLAESLDAVSLATTEPINHFRLFFAEGVPEDEVQVGQVILRGHNVAEE